jgi:hypothetical protein
MILCMTTNDMRIVNDAYKGYDSNVFGRPYCYLPDHNYRGMLNNDEDLFISAHGNNIAIGNKGDDLSLTPAQLKTVLDTDFLPGRYSGRLYISACGSAPVYVNKLRAAFGGAYNNRVFGMFGRVPLLIDPPTSTNWVTAT